MQRVNAISQVLLLSPLLMLFGVGCAGNPSVVRTDAASTTKLTYQLNSKETCDHTPVTCDTGYPFYNDKGCGCASTPVFPAGHNPLACTENADCELSYQRVNTCCGDLCTATQPYNKASIKLLKAWHKNHCDRAHCPVASCAESSLRYTAVCDAGTCKAVKSK